MAVLKDEMKGFVPTEQANEIVKLAVRGSSTLRLAKVESMTSEKKKVPVMAEGAGAYWVGEGKRIKTSKPTWIFPELVAKKLAVIIPVSKEKMEDATIDVFSELKETIAEAFYLAIDAAALFGINSPFEKNVFDVAAEKGNLIVRGTGSTFDLDVSSAMGMVEDASMDVNGNAAHYGIKNTLRQLRDKNGNMIYFPGTDGQQLYNNPIEFCRNGAWDKKKAELIVGDWNKLLVGIRKDIEYEILKEATLMETLDEDGKPLSLAEQDLIAIKATMRVGILQVMDGAFAVVVPEDYDKDDADTDDTNTDNGEEKQENG